MIKSQRSGGKKGKKANDNDHNGKADDPKGDLDASLANHSLANHSLG
ncbi:MAG: hypothetical protein HOL47_04725, partial [Chloroflexi bacterium]|nr:hypothetical protein [Chloroflexota bacterium]